jgi:glycine/D-amino acid oxidase-like deaminating enzyme
MIGAARSLGAILHIGARVQEIETRGDRVIGVKTQDGRRFPAEQVVNCAGRWANDPSPDNGLHIPLAPTVGFLVFTPPVGVRLRRIVRTPLVDMRPDGAGRIMLHRNETDATLTPDSKPDREQPQARDLVGRACQVLPGIGPVEAEAVRLAIRPIPKDGLSAIGPVPRIDGYYLAVTHSGVTLSPFLGIAVADEIVRGRIRPELARFRPARFFN